MSLSFIPSFFHLVRHAPWQQQQVGIITVCWFSNKLWVCRFSFSNWKLARQKGRVREQLPTQSVHKANSPFTWLMRIWMIFFLFNLTGAFFIGVFCPQIFISLPKQLQLRSVFGIDLAVVYGKLTLKQSNSSEWISSKKTKKSYNQICQMFTINCWEILSCCAKESCTDEQEGKKKLEITKRANSCHSEKK